MKRSLAFSLALLCLLLSGCAAAPQNRTGASASSSDNAPASKRDSIPFTDGQLYAAAYLGWQQPDGLAFYVEHYLDHDRLPTHYLSPGDYYLVIPRYAGMTMELYRNDFETGEAVLVFETPDCQPFLLQCNVSDIFADAVVRLSYEGRSAEFSPFISLKDGSVEIGPEGLELTKQ